MPFRLSRKTSRSNDQNRMTSRLVSYVSRVSEFINDAACLDLIASSSRFRTIAVALFTFQFEHNPAYRQLCLSRHVTPQNLKSWSEIPAAPTAAFKERDLTCLPPEARTTVFWSSGTTTSERSRHFHSAESLAVYEQSLLPAFKAAFLRDPNEKLRCAFLTPAAHEAPHSSLVHMFETARRSVGAEESFFAGRAEPDGDWSLNVDVLIARLIDWQRTPHPVVLLGTAFNFVHLLDALVERELRLRLPAGSRVMETGGYKGRSRALPKESLHALLTEYLGIDRAGIVCEYGMCELSSQAYDHSFRSGAAVAKRLFRFPPWARFLIISPETGLPVEPGEPGLLRVFDLANIASVLAVQTEDITVRQGDGFELLGRAALTEPRGCSLMSA
jgi:hypothetical protein